MLYSIINKINSKFRMLRNTNVKTICKDKEFKINLKYYEAIE